MAESQAIKPRYRNVWLGLVVGAYYWRSGRLFPVIVAHIAADIVALA